MIWGFNVSSIDLPSLKNSGFVKNPKPFPLDFCENFSSNGNKAAGTRARKAAGEIKKMVTDYRKASVAESK